jgi:ribonuclease BN (tRNA processing enzyme)
MYLILPQMSAALVAKESGAKKQLLTHFRPEDDVACHLAEAKKSFGNVRQLSSCTYDIIVRQL